MSGASSGVIRALPTAPVLVSRVHSPATHRREAMVETEWRSSGVNSWGDSYCSGSQGDAVKGTTRIDEGIDSPPWKINSPEQESRRIGKR